jgi:hypothetical protein
MRAEDQQVEESEEDVGDEDPLALARDGEEDGEEGGETAEN